MKGYYRFLTLLVLLFAVGLSAVWKITGTGDGSQNNEDVLLLNEIAHEMVHMICRLKTQLRNGNMSYWTELEM